jgi:membrane fusion protein, multidrug efflux system
MKSFTNIFFIAILSVLMYSSCGSKNNTQDNEETSGTVVRTVLAMETTYSDVFEFSGTCFANKEANIGSSIPGKVEKIHAKPGQFVREGQVIVSMSSEALILSEVEYRTLEKDFDRVSRLREKGSISEQDYDHVKAKYDASKAKYDLMKNNTEIRAPFSGMVTDIIVQEGENFLFAPSLDLSYSMTSGIIRIMQLNPMIIKFPLNEKLISRVSTGSEVSIHCDAWPDRTYKGKISLIHPKFNTMTRTTDVEVTVPNPDSSLKPGMFARVHLEGLEKTGCSIPVTSIISRRGSEFVWINENGKAMLKKVERLAMKGEDAIVSGIEPGTEIIVTRKSGLSEGMPVIVKND